MKDGREGGRVTYSWGVCAVGRGYGGIGGARDGGGGWHASGTKPGESCDGRCRRNSRVRADAQMKPDHAAILMRRSE